MKCDASNKQKHGSDSDETDQFAKITPVQSLTESLQSFGWSPIKKKRLVKGKYRAGKMKRTENVKTTILNIPENIKS